MALVRVGGVLNPWAGPGGVLGGARGELGVVWRHVGGAMGAQGRGRVVQWAGPAARDPFRTCVGAQGESETGVLAFSH